MIAVSNVRSVVPGKKGFKVFVVKAVFWFLGKGTEAAARLDSRIAAEVAAWDEGACIVLKVNPQGPAMSMGKINGRLRYLGKKETEAELAIYFKNIEAAVLILTGQMGIDRGFAEHRYGMKGDIAFGMSLVRILNIVEAYLFPGFITRRIMKRMPGKQHSSLRIYFAALFGV